MESRHIFFSYRRDEKKSFKHTLKRRQVAAEGGAENKWGKAPLNRTQRNTFIQKTEENLFGLGQKITKLEEGKKSGRKEKEDKK